MKSEEIQTLFEQFEKGKRADTQVRPNGSPQRFAPAQTKVRNYDI